MKRIFTFIAALLALILVACEKETVLTIDQTSLSFTDTGGSQTVSLTANKSWSVKCDQSWCKVSPSSGEEAASSKISISCDANTTYDARNCTVTFTCAELTKTVSISQATNNGLLVSQTSYELTKAAQQLEIQVQANVKFSAEVGANCKDWITYKTTKGLTTNTVVLDIAENKSYDSRQGQVTIKQDGGNLSSTITIKQSQLDGLFISTPEYNLSNEKHTLTVEVSSNVEFEVIPGAEWVKYIQTKGLSSKQIILEVAENDTYDQRETTVIVKQKNGDLSGTIKINQDEKYGILVTQSEYTLSNEAQTIDVEVRYNVDFDVVIPDECKDWVSIVGTKGLSSRTYTFAVTKNGTYDNRESSITFKQKNGSLSGSVVIKQAQTDGLIAEKTHYTVTAEEQTLEIRIKSNVPYVVMIDDACKDWLTVIDTKGLTENIVSLFVVKNEGDTRKGKVYLKSEGIQEEIIIVQEAERYVYFADDNFKAYCVENFDKNEDGEISISEALAVTEIHCENRGIEILSVNEFKNLKVLSCHDNFITLIHVNECTSLTSLDCSNNYMGILDVSGCTLLEYLDCHGKATDYYNSLSLYASGCTALCDINCSFRWMREIDVSGCTALTTLDCNRNGDLIQLNICGCTSLTTIRCPGHHIINLDLSGHTSLKTVDCSSPYMESLDVSGCTSLTYLDCSWNLLNLDISGCKALTYLICRGSVPSLDLRDCPALKELYCGGNQLSSLNVSCNKELVKLYCSNSSLTSLDVSSCEALESLYCESNRLTGLDLSHNTKLDTLVCFDNQLTSINVSGCTSLKMLYCPVNQLTSLDVSDCNALERLDCNNNLIESLDVRNKTSLRNIRCYNNPLTNLNVSGCMALELLDYHSHITAGIGNKLTNLDVSGCSALKELICYSMELHDGSRGQLATLNLNGCTSLTRLECGGNQLTSLNLKDCVALSELECSGNPLSDLDVRNCVELTVLSCGSRYLTSLDLSNNTALKYLGCASSLISSLDVSNCKALESIDCSGNKLTNLDLSGCTALKRLTCGSNQLTTLILYGCGALTNLDCSINQLERLDLRDCKSLSMLLCHGNKLTSLTFSDYPSLWWIECSSNQLTSLDVSKATGLELLSCFANRLTTLDVSNNMGLGSLSCQMNPLLTEIWLKAGQTIDHLNYDASITTIKYKD